MDKEQAEAQEEFLKMQAQQKAEWAKQIEEEKNKQPPTAREASKGLGDTIKKVTDFLHIPQCGGCKKRQAALNKAFPYK